MKELKLLKGNEAIAVAAMRCGCDAYFGYPITPQSEVMETLTEQEPWKTTGMVVLQAESEVASINMVYGAASAGKKAMTSSSSPGISLMTEGISYLAGAELPALIVNVMRGGPGLGTIQPSQADYFQAVKGGGHGDYSMITLAPSSVQEMNDFVEKGFDLAFKYRTPVMILADGIIGQMMEKVWLSEPKPRLTEEQIIEKYGDWATTGKKRATRNIVTSVNLEATVQEAFNQKLQAKYATIRKEEVVFEEIQCDDAEYVFVAFGTSARICLKSVEILREQGIKVGLLRPITLFPFPTLKLEELSKKAKGFMVIEMNAGQMLEDVKLAANGNIPVEFYGRMGGVIPTPIEVVEAFQKTFLK